MLTSHITCLFSGGTMWRFTCGGTFRPLFCVPKHMPCSRPWAHQCCPACEAELENQIPISPPLVSVVNVHEALSLPSSGPGMPPYQAVVDSPASTFWSAPSHILDVHAPRFYPTPAERSNLLQDGKRCLICHHISND